MTRLPLHFPCSTVFPRVQWQDRFFSLSHWPTLLTTTVSIIKSSQMTPSYTMPPSQVTFVLWSLILNPALSWSKHEWSKTLTDDKTKASVVGSCSCTSLTDSQSVEVGGNHSPFSTCIKDLCVHLDSTLSVHQHVSYLCCPSFLAVRRIASIWSYLTESTTAQLV